MVNPLTSLLLPARIPAIALVTWRGRPGERDEPQHELTGRITAGLLSLIEVEADLVPADPALLPGALERILAELPESAAVVSIVGLGVALHTPRPVVVLDGDGAALMRLGSLATVAAHGPAGLTHVVLDNGAHDSTGGQRTLSASADLAAVAAACGYAQVHACGDADDLAVALRRSLAGPGPSFIYLPIRRGSMYRLGRPQVTPVEVARRFRAFASAPHEQALSPTPPAVAADPVRG